MTSVSNDVKTGGVEGMDMGIQPLDAILEKLGLSNHDVVAASGEQLTHKVVQKGRRGRQLTRRAQDKILRALTRAAGAGANFSRDQLFTYEGRI